MKAPPTLANNPSPTPGLYDPEWFKKTLVFVCMQRLWRPICILTTERRRTLGCFRGTLWRPVRAEAHRARASHQRLLCLIALQVSPHTTQPLCEHPAARELLTHPCSCLDKQQDTDPLQHVSCDVVGRGRHHRQLALLSSVRFVCAYHANVCAHHTSACACYMIYWGDVQHAGDGSAS